MRCLSPRTVGFQADGKTISWSPKTYSKEYATFQLPCSKCMECRLEYARQWAVRCTHEAQMHEENSFITLTYKDEELRSDRLQYVDFQEFMKRLRFHHPNNEISYMVTGEYGDQNKRPHWHAIIFGYYPRDATYLRSNDRGDEIYSSATLDKIWGKNDPVLKPNEIGAVTFDSAGYVARYAAKKLTHGYDQDHDYHPISKKSSRRAIGKRFLEKYWTDIFNDGHVILPDGTKTSIPRFYEKWLQQHQPERWCQYVTQLKAGRIANAEAQAAINKQQELETNLQRHADGKISAQISRSEVRSVILKDRLKSLINKQSGD